MMTMIVVTKWKFMIKLGDKINLTFGFVFKTLRNSLDYCCNSFLLLFMYIKPKMKFNIYIMHNVFVYQPFEKWYVSLLNVVFITLKGMRDGVSRETSRFHIILYGLTLSLSIIWHCFYFLFDWFLHKLKVGNGKSVNTNSAQVNGAKNHNAYLKLIFIISFQSNRITFWKALYLATKAWHYFITIAPFF